MLHGPHRRHRGGPPGSGSAARPVTSAALAGAVARRAAAALADLVRGARHPAGGLAGRRRQQEGVRLPLDAFARLLLLVGPVLLLLRLPVPPSVASSATAAVAVVYLGAGYPYGPVFLTVAVACFAAVVAGHRRAAWWARLGLLWAGHLLVAALAVPVAAARRRRPAAPGGRSWSSPPGWSPSSRRSELARTRREQWARERAERAAAERRRADEERLRIARELHDVLAHSISVINVQAGVGLALLDSDPRTGPHRAHHHQGRQQGGAGRGASGPRHPAHARRRAACPRPRPRPAARAVEQAAERRA